MKPSVYLETTIISYLAARPSRDLIVAAQQQVTQLWWTSRRDEFDVFISPAVKNELGRGDHQAASRRLELIANVAILEINPRVLRLAQNLVNRGILPHNANQDALHIAFAAVHGMDFLLTWNCRHIANAMTSRYVNETCRMEGFEPPIICTPQSMIGDFI